MTNTKVRERPIPFSAPMVRAILDGRKTQTRRVIRNCPLEGVGSCHYVSSGWAYASPTGGCRCEPHPRGVTCPFGVPGDRLWVREAWAPESDGTGCPEDDGILYRATDSGWDDEQTGLRWRPSIHMPRRASRITLEVVSVRVEKLQCISEADAKAEGVPRQPIDSAPGEMFINDFAYYWDHLNGNRPGCSWDDNPWVWPVEFRRLP